MNDVAAGATMLGIPATPERDQMLILATVQKLPEMRKQLKAIEKAIAQLQVTQLQVTQLQVTQLQAAQLQTAQAVPAPRVDDQAAA